MQTELSERSSRQLNQVPSSSHGCHPAERIPESSGQVSRNRRLNGGTSHVFFCKVGRGKRLPQKEKDQSNEERHELAENPQNPKYKRQALSKA